MPRAFSDIPKHRDQCVDDQHKNGTDQQAKQDKLLRHREGCGVLGDFRCPGEASLSFSRDLSRFVHIILVFLEKHTVGRGNVGKEYDKITVEPPLCGTGIT